MCCTSKRKSKKVIKHYKELGIKLDKTDYLFMNPTSKTRKNYGRMIMYNRLKQVFRESGYKMSLIKRIRMYRYTV